MNRFAALVLAIVCVSAEARAGVELGGVLGLHMFNEENGLGTPDGAITPVSLENSALFGLRLGVYFGSLLGVEAEGGMIPGETRKGEAMTTPLVAVTALTYRGHLIAQFRAANPANRILPFVVAGGGVLQIVNTNNASVIEEDSQVLFYAGAGAKYRTKDGWIVRLDGRVLSPPGNDGRILEFEALLGIGKDFGHKGTVKPKEEPVPPTDLDPDKDGITGAADQCPNEAEDMDSFQDEDGCIDADNDGDGLADASDKCPIEAEDKDNFEDEDGCPDPDNDGDGVPDAADKCGDQPETKNGFEDEDGCPDEIPEKLKKFTGVIQGITFKTNSVELIGGSKKTLDAAAAVLVEFKDAKLEIQGHTDDQPLKKGSTFADNAALSQGRAESVRAYLMTKGVEEARVIAKGYGPTVPVVDPTGLKGGKLNQARAKNRRVEFKLISGDEAGATPAPTPAPETPTTETPAPAPTE
ncbi:MAG: OmpA family protein [Deltaproteobacteria bacterium]|nr:OmpA family protein [Deltaproteobacteria bacterium]